MAIQIQLRRGTASQWTTANTLLAQGELGLETDTNKFKFGDGVTTWNSLPYYANGSVTSVALSGGTTGLTVTGSPITTSGTITLGGTLDVDNGGTGQTSYTDGQLLIGNTTGNTLTKTTLTAGSGIAITNGSGSISIAATNSGTVTAVTGTSPVVSSGGATPAISLASGYGDTQNPYASKTANFILGAPNGVSGVPTFRAVVAADIPTLNQSTTGSAATLTTTRAIYGNNFDGSAALTQVIASTYGGTGNGFAKLSGPATIEKTFTLPNASSTILTDNAAVTVLQGGTGATTASGARTNLSAASSGSNTDITSIALTTGTVSTAPSSSTDIVNKSYADSIASGVNFHAACNYATTATLGTVTYNNGTAGVGATLTNGGTQAALTIDGYTFTGTDVTNATRVLVKNQTTQTQNGVYIVTNQGSASTNWVLTRATDYDTSGSGTNEIDIGDLLLVISGTTNSNTSWVQQTPLPITVGTTNIVFIQFAAIQTYTAGTGLSLSTNQFSITNVGTANTYGSASAVPVITTNSQGQVTAVTNTAIAIAGSAVTGNISGNAANVTGTVAIANGGTGQTTQAAALTALTGTQTSGYYVRSNGTNSVLAAIQAADVPTLNQNTTGSAASLSATLAIASGGTGQTTASSAFNALSPITSTGDLIIGNGTNSATRLAIGTNGYVLTSNGTTASWVAASSGSGTVTSVAATVPSFLSVTGSPITTSGTLAIALASTPTNGQLLIGNGTGFSYSTLTAGSNITITNSAGGITIASSGGGGSSSPIPKLLSWSIGGF